MSKFNKKTVGNMKTTNKSGFAAYKMEDKLKLSTMVLTTMFGESKFYGDNSSELVELSEKVDPKFLAKLAIYARNEFNMRSVSHVLASVLAHRVDGKQYVKKVCSEIMKRPDDVTETLQFYISMYGKPIPNSLKKGLSVAMNSFSAYQLAKYNGKKEMKLKDVLRICHTKPITVEQSLIFYELINDVLETPYTWEVELSKRGNTKEVWEELIDSGKVGYMALLRNLRNIVLSGASNIDKVYDKLSDRDEVLKSKQLPFRFYSAYHTLRKDGIATSKLLDVLETAIKESTSNIEQLPGKTLIAIDVSGSMGNYISRKSDVECCQIASLLGSIGNYICEECQIVTFDTILRQYAFPRSGGILMNAANLEFHGGGTKLSLPFEHILYNQMHFDRVILLSDNEVNRHYNSSGSTCQRLVDKYRKEVNENIWVHAIDLQGYGTQQFNGKNTNIIAGWSEKVFEFISYAESGQGNLVSEIEKIEL